MTTNETNSGFLDPLEVVDRTDLTYEARLRILQDWRARLTRGDADREEVTAIDGAIQALEMGARVQGDDSDEVPEGYTDRKSR